MGVTASAAPVATVVGEALIDLVPSGQPTGFIALPGGSPFNVAVGTARLGTATSLLARLADNPFGRILRERAAAEQIELSACPAAAEPTTLAVVSFDTEAHASYDFYFQGTADWQWTDAELAGWEPPGGIFHFGSIASWTAPGSGAIGRLVKRVRETSPALVTYDPNIRPSLLADQVTARSTIEASVAYADLVKASQEDLQWLYPERGEDWVTDRWLELGAVAVVITSGSAGATARTAAGYHVTAAGSSVPVVDTIGAGDSFMSGLIASLLEQGIASRAALIASEAKGIVTAVELAVLTSSITCTRPGADPPRRNELRAGGPSISWSAGGGHRQS